MVQNELGEHGASASVSALQFMTSSSNASSSATAATAAHGAAHMAAWCGFPACLHGYTACGVTGTVPVVLSGKVARERGEVGPTRGITLLE